LKALFPVFCRNKGTTHTCYALLKAMRDDTLPIEYWSSQFATCLKDDFLRPGMPWMLFRALGALRLAGRQSIKTWARHRLQQRYLQSLRNGDVAYLWPAVRVELYQAVKERGIPLVAERINCHRKTSVRILTEAYEKLGWRPDHGISEEDMAIEDEKMSLSDFIFAPSDNVAASLLDAGVPEQKVLQSSYGWDPQRFRFENRAPSEPGNPKFLFVGRACVRKGLPWLLKMWEQAGIKGTLFLYILGSVEPGIAERYSHHLDRDDVIIRVDTSDMNEAYRQADVFIFPTHEEGSPLVSYEALAWGLPCLVSPMGAGTVIRDRVEGYVMNPYDVQLWAENIRKIALNRELREQMGAAARQRALEFTWDRVGARRRAQLLEVLHK
ncbi:MAG: glycosyltransferase family 4 protein, partial [Candidatus Hydrogenedentota bacterium]